MKTIYFGGTFSKQEIGQLSNFRNDIITTLRWHGFNVKDPLRNKFMNGNSGKVTKDTTMEDAYINCQFTPNEIVHRDLNDINNSDLLLMNLIEPSVGSSCEIMYASLQRKPIIVVTTNPLIKIHPWINSLCTKIFDNMNEAIDYIANYLVD